MIRRALAVAMLAALTGCSAASVSTTVPSTTTTTHPALPACGPNYIGGVEPPAYCTPGA